VAGLLSSSFNLSLTQKRSGVRNQGLKEQQQTNFSNCCCSTKLYLVHADVIEVQSL